MSGAPTPIKAHNPYLKPTNSAVVPAENRRSIKSNSILRSVRPTSTPTPPLSAWELYGRRRTPSIHAPPRLFLFPRDNDRRRGLYRLENEVTELSGEGGSGKTQICLSLCLDCVMDSLNSTEDNDGMRPGIHWKAIYISTGMKNGTIAGRLEGMLRTRLMMDRHNSNYRGIVDMKSNIKSILSRVYLASLRNEDEFLHFIGHILPRILCGEPSTSKIGLVIIDGIASLFRFSDPLHAHQLRDSSFFTRRAGHLWMVSSRLRKYADDHDLPILITNQVTAVTSNCGEVVSGDAQVIPALGLIWSHCVGTRYKLRRSLGGTQHDGGDHLRKQFSQRYARVLQSVNLPVEREVRFGIADSGVALLT